MKRVENASNSVDANLRSAIRLKSKLQAIAAQISAKTARNALKNGMACIGPQKIIFQNATPTLFCDNPNGQIKLSGDV